MIGIINPYRYITIPTGLIVPYSSSAAIPSGWVVFALADGKYIVAADGSDPYYSIGSHLPIGISIDASGLIAVADNTRTIKFWSTESGLHTGQTFEYWQGTGAPDGTMYYNSGSLYDGNHKHQITIAPTLAYNQMRLIKATSNQDKLPKDAIIFGHSNLGLTQMWNNDNKYLKANNSITSANFNYTQTVSYEGSHDHHWATDGNSFVSAPNATQLQPWYSSGTLSPQLINHNHGLSNVIIAENMKKVYLTAWTNALSAFSGVHGMIAMWESFTPPDGWVVCDGTNGTKDLRKYFIMLGSTSNQGTFSGDNTFNISATLDNWVWSHDHTKSRSYNIAEGLSTITPLPYNHPLNNAEHNHSTSFNGNAFLIPPIIASYLPEYYSLVFIQKL